MELNGTSPLLVLLNERADNLFGRYIQEILRAEGVNSFHTADISALDLNILSQYDILILAEGPLTSEQIELLEGYVFGGGRLLAMRPDPQLSHILGLDKASGGLSEAYLKTVADTQVTSGITPASMQYHGTADLYTTAGAEVIAWLWEDRSTASEHPGIAINRFGSGIAAMWAFDLAKSIAYTRQGNPKWANQERDGLDGIRTVDMFVGWIDLDRISIPQADEQQRLFINVLVLLSSDKRPLPRTWYFPGDYKCILVCTGDSHMNPSPFIEGVLDRLDEFSGRMSVYYAPVIYDDIGRAVRKARFLVTDNVPILGDVLAGSFTSPTPDDVEGWRQRGHEFALHPYVEHSLQGGWEEYWKEFTGRGYGPVPPTVRTHRILWDGWVESARIQASYGIRMNLDYYHVGPSLQKESGEWVYGHLTGSGRPMKFVDEQGRILNIYQQLTQLTDEHLIPMDVPGWGGWPGLTPEEAVEVSKYLFDQSISQGAYCAIAGQFHIDPFQVGGDAAEKAEKFLTGTLKYAQEKGIPIWSAQEWLAFTEARDVTNFQGITWDEAEKALRFEVVASKQHEFEITIMVPVKHSSYHLSFIELNQMAMSYQNITVGGVDYAYLGVDPHSQRIVARYD